MTLGQKIAQAREKKGITQTELAEKVGVSSVFICRVESGYKVPGVFVLKEIAKTLDVTVDSLLV